MLWGKWSLLKISAEWQTCGRDIWILCSAKKHDGWGVSLHDLFLTSCCVKALWLCNLPCGLKQCRLVFFSLSLYLCFHPFSDSWFVTVLSWWLCFLEFSFDLVFTGLSVSWPVLGHMSQSWPHLPFSAGADGVCLWPFPHLGGQGRASRGEVGGWKAGGLLRATGRWGVVQEEAGDSAGDPQSLGQVAWSKWLQLQDVNKLFVMFIEQRCFEGSSNRTWRSDQMCA